MFLVLLLIYLRFDFNFVYARIANREVEVRKGLFVFRNRRVTQVPLAQLVSVRVEEETGGADWELIYYNHNNDAFYSDVILSGAKPDSGFLREMLMNKVAVFRS